MGAATAADLEPGVGAAEPRGTVVRFRHSLLSRLEVAAPGSSSSARGLDEIAASAGLPRLEAPEFGVRRRAGASRVRSAWLDARPNDAVPVPGAAAFRRASNVETQTARVATQETRARSVAPKLDEVTLARALDLFAPMSRYHRFEVSGLDHIPRHGPALLVGNHNGGLNPVDGLFLVEHYRQRGASDPVYVLAHDLLFRMPRLAAVLGKLGIVPAHPSTASSLLAAGHKVLVFPGGDLENMRPFSARKRINLAGRRGFLRIAAQTQSPIVPVVNCGGHETCVILSQGREFARALGLPHRARVHSVPIVLAAPWGILMGPTCALPYFPLPAKVNVEIGQPIAPPPSDDPVVLSAHYRDLEGRMQGTMDRLYAARRFPVFG